MNILPIIQGDVPEFVLHVSDALQVYRMSRCAPHGDGYNQKGRGEEQLESVLILHSTDEARATTVTATVLAWIHTITLILNPASGTDIRHVLTITRR